MAEKSLASADERRTILQGACKLAPGHRMEVREGRVTTMVEWFHPAAPDATDARDEAQRIEDINIHDFRLHPLRGNYRDFWSVTVRANWRIIFRFEGGKVFDVELIDYH